MTNALSDKIRIVFLGTPAFSLPALQILADAPEIDIAAVVTQPDRPAGRGRKLTPPPVRMRAEQLGLPVFQTVSIKKDEDLKAHLRALAPDFFVTIAFGQILTQDVLDIPAIGTVNAHASLLPELRGANPIQQAILDGKTETGVTTMLTELGVDTGPMLLKRTLAIGGDETLGELTDRLAQVAGPLLAETLIGLKSGAIQPRTQSHDRATHAPKCRKEDALLDWTEPAERLHRRIRAFNPAPGATAFLTGANPGDSAERIKLLRATVFPSLSNPPNPDSGHDGEPGEIRGVTPDGILVATGRGTLLIRSLQPAGKREMPARDWFLGCFPGAARSASGETHPLARFQVAPTPQPV
jgi:methionyl-tRNA formyltransferase